MIIFNVARSGSRREKIYTNLERNPDIQHWFQKLYICLVLGRQYNPYLIRSYIT